MDKIVILFAGGLIFVVIAFFLVTKAMLENVDNVDEDEDGFFDRRDRV